MMAEAVRHLRVIDANGEIVDEPISVSVAELQAEVRNLRAQLLAKSDVEDKLRDMEIDLAGKRAQIRLLKGQLIKEVEGFERFDDIRELFRLWQRLCRHPRSVLDDDRATALRKLWSLKREDGSGYSMREGRLAILGAAEAAYVDKAGKRHDAISLIFRNAEKFEDFCNRGALVLRKHPEYLPIIDGEDE